jgi:hypothetical protein
MAGDWIKMRSNLDTHPKVFEIADLLGVAPLHAVGMLWKLWSWADTHSADGNAIRVTDLTLDAIVGHANFATALRTVGWVVGESGALSFPNFEKHNGASAKKRAESQERTAKHRSRTCNASVTPKALPEKRREEKRREDKTLSLSASKSTDLEPPKTTSDHPRTDPLPSPNRSPSTASNTPAPESITTSQTDSGTDANTTTTTTASISQRPAIWQTWRKHLTERMKPLTETADEFAWMNLVRQYPDEHDRQAVIEFSIARGAENLILNGDHARTVATASSGGGNHPTRSRRAPTWKELGL